MLNKKKSEQTKSWTAGLLDDLTHLEINTVIKHGMTATAQPDTLEETVATLVSRYRAKLESILRKNEVEFSVAASAHYTIKDFHDELKRLQTELDNQDIRLEEADYILYLRFIGFCSWIYSKKDTIEIEDRSADKIHSGKKLYQLNLSRYEDFSFVDMSPKDRAKIKRMFDLGTETVVMQTRFGIDGDVITRIEKGFAQSPKQVILDMHDKHTNLSLNYWQRIVDLAVNVIKELVK